MTQESQNIEFKESWRDEYLKWICGFTKRITDNKRRRVEMLSFQILGADFADFVDNNTLLGI